MVYPEILDLKKVQVRSQNDQETDARFDSVKNRNPEGFKARAHQRILASVIDYFIFSPLVLFILTIIFSDGFSLIRKFPYSLEVKPLMFILIGSYILFYSFLQAVYIAIYRATPGQSFSKTYIHFENDQFPVFLQAWFRQLGFVVSFLLLGFPFISIFFHPKNKTFYDRISESTVLTRVEFSNQFVHWTGVERRYLSTAVATFIVFGLGLFFVFGSMTYQKSVQSFLTYNDLQNKQIFCEELKNVEQDQKLIVGISLNLIDQLSDQCLEKEADFVLWKQSGLQQQSADYNLSMAYFSKFISTGSEAKEKKYLELACQTGPQTRGCLLAEDFKNLDYFDFYKKIQVKNKQNNQVDQLDRILELEFARLVHPESLLDNLKNLKNKNYVNLDLFLIKEKLKIIHGQMNPRWQQRNPAAFIEVSGQHSKSELSNQDPQEILGLVLQELQEL